MKRLFVDESYHRSLRMAIVISSAIGLLLGLAIFS